MADIKVHAKDLHAYLARVYQAVGLPESDANACAAQIVDAELRGVNSHGCVRFGVFVERLRNGTANPKPSVRTITDLPAFSLLDGDYGMSAVVARRAMEVAIEKAKTGGIGAAAIRKSSHTGHIGYFAAMALEHGMIGMVISGAVGNLAPWGGSDRMIGNNPVAFAVPSNQEYPILFGHRHIQGGERLCAPGRQVGRADPRRLGARPFGQPDPRTPPSPPRGPCCHWAITRDTAWRSCSPFLTGALTGNGFDADQPDWLETDKPFGLPMFAMAIDPERCLGGDYKAAVDEAVTRIKASGLAPGFDEIRIPGEGAHHRYQAALSGGITLKEALARDLDRIAEEVGVAPLPKG